MTKKDYEVIADAIAASVGDLHIEPAVYELTENLAVAFRRDNPRFNRAVFMRRALGEAPDPSVEWITLVAAQHTPAYALLHARLEAAMAQVPHGPNTALPHSLGGEIADIQMNLKALSRDVQAGTMGNVEKKKLLRAIATDCERIRKEVFG